MEFSLRYFSCLIFGLIVAKGSLVCGQKPLVSTKPYHERSVLIGTTSDNNRNLVTSFLLKHHIKSSGGFEFHTYGIDVDYPQAYRARKLLAGRFKKSHIIRFQPRSLFERMIRLAKQQ